MRRNNFYKKLILRISSAVKASRIPKSFSKKNNNKFSNSQHIIFQALMQLEGKRFRDMPDFLELLKAELSLREIPHFSTINKFGLRIKSAIVEKLISTLVN